jgi:hypothetical protein
MTLHASALFVLLSFAGSLNADDKPPAKGERKTSFNFGGTELIGGKVLAVTKDSILIAPERGKPTTYPAHDFLASGKVHEKVRPANSYLLSDVKVGDYVHLDTIVENMQTFCVAISISERPGGLIPAGQVVAKERTYHEVRNAIIALRDKGTPIPEHLKPKIPALEETPKK